MWSPVQTAELIQWLETPNSYRHRPDSVQRIETHISQVFLAGTLVYKLKKPVKFSFVDFTSLAAREQACREEVRLNRRLAESIYLGTVPITRDAAGHFGLGGEGDVVDWLVQMRRLPENQMLDRLHATGQLQPLQIDQLSALLARFYASALRAPYAPATYHARCVAHVRENRDTLRSTMPPNLAAEVDRIHGFQLQLLHLRPELFTKRVEGGFVVEGHGDLRAEHICLDEPIAIFDCIEFLDEFRFLDVADELAFLASDCDFIGATWVGSQLFAHHEKLTGDRPDPALLAFYQSYRACVRAKVAALRAAQLAGTSDSAAMQEARNYLEFAGRYIPKNYRPLLLAVGGLSGTGKSTLARGVAEALSAHVLSSDVVRQELFAPPQIADAVPVEKYSLAGRSIVYDELLRRAASLLDQGVSVIIDATFAQTSDLEAVQTLCRQHAIRFLAVECCCPPDVALQRIAQRLQAGNDASEAHADVYRQQSESRTPWPVNIPQSKVDTTMSIEDQLQRVFSELAALA